MTDSYTLYIFRHGETDWNKEQRFQGTADIELNDKGVKQTEELARQLKSVDFDLIVSSPLSRANETAKKVSLMQANSPLILVHDGLKERSFGVAEGMKVEDAKTTFFGVSNIDRDTGNPRFWNVKYPDGENRKEVFQRFKSAMSDICRDRPNDKTIAVSTHGSLMTSVLAHMLDQFKQFHNCEVMPVDFYPREGRFTLRGDLLQALPAL